MHLHWVAQALQPIMQRCTAPKACVQAHKDVLAPLLASILQQAESASPAGQASNLQVLASAQAGSIHV